MSAGQKRQETECLPLLWFRESICTHQPKELVKVHMPGPTLDSGFLNQSSDIQSSTLPRGLRGKAMASPWLGSLEDPERGWGCSINRKASPILTPTPGVSSQTLTGKQDDG